MLGVARTAAAIALLALCLQGTLLPTQAAGPRIDIHSIDATALPQVRVTFSLQDRTCTPTGGLTPAGITLLEDDRPVDRFTIEPVVNPLAPGKALIVIDVSGSSVDGALIAEAKSLAAAVVDLQGTSVKTAVFDFSDRLELIQGYRSDATQVKNAINSVDGSGFTSLHEAVSLATVVPAALDEPCSYVVLFTDGIDTSSRFSLQSTLDTVRAAGVPIISVGMGPTPDTTVLDSFTQASGGVTVPTSSRDAVLQAITNFQNRYRSAYKLTYDSTITASAAPRRVSLRATLGGVSYATDGAYTPPIQPVNFEIAGLQNRETLSGAKKVGITLTEGNPVEVQLLVDGMERAKVNAPPYIMDWDAGREGSGLHVVTFRAIGSAGQVTEKSVITEVPSGLPAALWVFLGLIVLVLILLAVLAVKRRMDEMEEADEEAEAAAEAALLAQMTERLVMPTFAPPPVLRAEVLVSNAGTRYDVVLDTEEILIGREPTSRIAILDQQVSRRHARIYFERETYWIEDLKSLNGTYVNGTAITRQELQHNDIIEIGSVSITFTLTESPVVVQHAAAVAP